MYFWQPGFQNGDNLNTNRTHPLHNLPERVQILGHTHIICITVVHNIIICCQIFCDLLINSAFERIFNVMQLILVKLSGILSKKYLIQKFYDIRLSYYFNSSINEFCRRIERSNIYQPKWCSFHSMFCYFFKSLLTELLNKNKLKEQKILKTLWSSSMELSRLIIIVKVFGFFYEYTCIIFPKWML